jgi:heptosyltransferase-2
LIQAINPSLVLCKPQLYPTPSDIEKVKQFQSQPYICIAPASVWFTKRFPIEQWVRFLNDLDFEGNVYIIGGPGDKELGDQIINSISTKAGINGRVLNLAGQLSYLSSAALQSGALLSYVNDSAPLHFASAVNAPVVAIFCSTIPAFGFGPISDKSFIVETQQILTCKPCGIHGRKACPMHHFNCGNTIQMQQLYAPLVQMKQH